MRINFVKFLFKKLDIGQKSKPNCHKNSAKNRKSMHLALVLLLKFEFSNIKFRLRDLRIKINQKDGSATPASVAPSENNEADQ